MWYNSERMFTFLIFPFLYINFLYYKLVYGDVKYVSKEELALISTLY